MLVLSRKSGESIEIGDQRVIVHVLSMRGSKVQLGIDAPREVAIHRSETLTQRSNRIVATPETEGQKTEGQKTEGQKVAASWRSEQLPLSEPSSPSGTSYTGASYTGASYLGANSLGDGFLQDLALAQTEVATLAEMANESDRNMARQVAEKAVARLTAIERALRVLTRRTLERPIAAFVESRSERLQQTSTDESDAPVDASELARKGEPTQDRDVNPPATTIREPASDYRLVPLT